ncbi:hypothetical protein Bbelb_325540 [Branchiostoma belcheri]|nr:hypothetical protein Bbelb_325540 [Branchiostoma belcheri]
MTSSGVMSHAHNATEAQFTFCGQTKHSFCKKQEERVERDKNPAGPGPGFEPTTKPEHQFILRRSNHSAKRSRPIGRVTFETAPVRHVLGVDAGRRHDAERAPYWIRPVPGQSPVLTRAACGRVPTGSYSSAGQLSGPWRVPGGIPTGSSRVFEQAGACSAARRVPGSEVTASLRRISPNGARSVFNSELKSIRRPRGAKNRPAAVGKPAGLRPVVNMLRMDKDARYHAAEGGWRITMKRGDKKRF